jgi:hypothetical protein
MTHEHEALELAVASLDFELTPAERTRMEAGLAACPECAALAASHIGLQNLLTQIPVHEASPIVRQRVLRAALVPPRRSQWQMLLVAAALLALLAAGAAVAGAFRHDPLDQLSNVPSSSPPALGDIVSPTPSGSADPSSSAAPPSVPTSITTGIADPTAGEQLLLGYVPRDIVADCVRSRTTASDPAIEGDVAGIDCPVTDSGAVTESRYFLFASGPQMQAWYDAGMKDMHLQPDSGGCLDGREGETAFAGGRLQCFVSGNGARLRWLDTNDLVYGVVVGAGDDLRGTLDWWMQTHQVADVRAEPRFTSVEQRLVDAAPPDIAQDCIPYRIVGAEATDVAGSVGAIDCLIDSSLVSDVGYFRFKTAAALNDWWDRRLRGLPVAAGSGGCRKGDPSGELRTAKGRMACYVTNGESRIRWTDADGLVYGALNGTNADLTRLIAWWDARHDR